jgi:hypothetical protein
MQIFHGVKGVIVELWLMVDTGCGASFGVSVNGGIPLTPQYQASPTGARAVWHLNLPDGLSSIAFVATPVSATATSCNLVIETLQNNVPLTPDAYNGLPGNPYKIAAIAVGAPYADQLDVQL